MAGKARQVVIVGGGFAGIRAALTLANKRGIKVILVSDKSFFEYRPALYRSATGRSLFEAVIPLRDFFKFARNIRVVKDKIETLDIKNKTINAEYGAVYHYDELILALGSVSAYFGIEGVEEHSFGVKTIHEALELKRHMHRQISDDKSGNHIVVVGAGATGVELSAEIVDYVKAVSKEQGVTHLVAVDVVEAAPRPMPALPEDMSKRIDKRLTELGITTYYNTAVQSETADELKLPSGSIRSSTVVWTAGMANNPFFAAHPDIFSFGRGGRVVVNNYLEARPNIYVLGDSADTKFTGMAQTAQRDGHFVARNILRSQSGKTARLYRPKKPVYATPVGPGWAAVLWGSLRFYGRVGALLRKLADIRFYFSVLPLRKAVSVWRYSQKKQDYSSIETAGSTPRLNPAPEIVQPD